MKNTNNTKLMFELSAIQMTEQNEETNKKIEDKIKIEKEIPKINNYIHENEFKKNIDKDTITKQTNTESTEEKTNVETKHTEKNEKLTEQINYIKQIRIDNTLAKFNKKLLVEIKSKMDSLNELLLNPDYSNYASILLDGSLKAASDEYLIFVYKTERIANLFNENITKIENTISKVLNKKYNIIATDNDNWEIIKDEYNHKKREFIYKIEDFNIEEILKENNGEIETIFEDIIEYN